MAPYKKRSYRRGSRDKYSVEQTIVQGVLSTATTTSTVVVPASTIEGMRKVKHLTISAMMAGTQAEGVLWALFYLPAGMTAPGFSTTSGTPLVEPNQFVMAAGCFDNDAGPLRIHSRVSRNLNSGDSIVLLTRPITHTAGAEMAFTALVRYAITLQ